MHADYLEIKKKFLSHAAPKRSMAGMPSDIRTAGPSGMRQKSIDKEAKNNPALRIAKRTYASLIDVAKRYNSGKISLEQAESLYRGLQNSFDSGFYKNSEMSQDTAISAFLSGDTSSETEGMKNLGFSDSDIREVLAFMKAVGNGGHWSRGSKAGMPSNIKHVVSHASIAGMPSNVRKKAGAFNKTYYAVDKAPTSEKWKAAGSNALSGYANNLNKLMNSMVSTGKQAVAQYNSAIAGAKQSNNYSVKLMDALNAYNNIVRQNRALGNNAKFKKATVKYKDMVNIDTGFNAIAVYDCVLTDTDVDPGDQRWS